MPLIILKKIFSKRLKTYLTLKRKNYKYNKIYNAKQKKNKNMNMMFKINNDSYNLPLNIFSSDVIAVSCVLKTTVLLSLSS